MIRLSPGILESIRLQAREEMPNEACGYLAGHTLPDGTLLAVEPIRMTNVDASPDHFSFAPAQQFAAVKKARDAGLQLVSVYHSHPSTPARMSEEDIRLANDTRMIYLIYSVAEDSLRGFEIDSGKNVSPHPVEVIG
jgi:proteasome lid subunit RPN8/RPN11